MNALGGERPREVGDRLGGARQRLGPGDLGSDVHVQADHLQARPRRHLSNHRRAVFDRHAELGALQAGRDVRVAAGVDVGVDADGHAGPRALGGSEVGDARQLARTTRR